MSTWKVIVPEPTINYCLNSSGEIAGNFAAVGGGTHTRVTTYQFFDVWSYRVQTAANNQGGSFTLQALANAVHYVTMRVSGTLPASWDWSVNDVAYTTPALIEDIDGTWSLYGLQFPAAQCNGSTLLYVRQNGAGAGDFNLDGIQVEQKTYWTTFCDGTRPGCWWDGAEHASTSQRSEQSRAGGRVQDLQDDYHLNVSGFIGTGLPPITNTVDSYAILPGGQLNAIKVQSRIFTLPGTLSSTSISNLHADRQDLLNVLKPNAVPGDASGPQPVRLRYTGATVQKQIMAHYEAGLETSIAATLECWEKVAVRFLADDPYWYEIGDSAEVLDSNDNATYRTIAGRERATGQWDLFPLPNILGSYTDVRTIVIGPDRHIYFGGDFQNWDFIGGADRIAGYNHTTGAYFALGAGAVGGVVWALIFGPDGVLYIGGTFGGMGPPVANTDGIASWNGAVYSALGTGVDNNAVYTLAIGLDGTLYAGGTFTQMSGVANTIRIAAWDGAAWSALGTGANNTVFAATVGPDGYLYIGGDFTTLGGAAHVRIGYWDGTTWNNMGDANNTVRGLAFDSTGVLYAVGDFTVIGGVTVSRAAKWNGTSWEPLGTGINNTGRAVEVGPDNMVYVGGDFTAAGGITLTDRVAKWNGSSWAHLDLNLPGAPIVYTVETDAADPVVTENYDINIGFDITGLTGYFSGDIMVANDGTEAAYPQFIISRTGGTSAVLEQIRNETTGKELLFDYSLLDGETLIIDLTPTSKSIVSSHFGSRMDAILPNSDFGSFALQPGNNLITCFVDTDATVTAFIQWDDKYLSQD